MNNHCIYIRKRKNKPYCILLKKEIELSECKICVNKVYNAQKNGNIVQKKKKHHTKRRITVSKDTYNYVIERDNYSCRLCGSTYWLAIHHIKYRSERRDLINNVDNCIMLCEECHRKVHTNKKKWQPILLDMNKKDL